MDLCDGHLVILDALHHAQYVRLTRKQTFLQLFLLLLLISVDCVQAGGVACAPLYRVYQLGLSSQKIGEEAARCDDQPTDRSTQMPISDTQVYLISVLSQNNENLRKKNKKTMRNTALWKKLY